MNGKVIDSGNSLTFVLPLAALLIILLAVFWPLILSVFVIALVFKLWEKFRFQQLAAEIDPVFNQILQANKGYLTILDLTSKTRLTAKTARWYLDKKAEEYGGIKRQYEDKGIVYYFLTASTLGGILDDSEPSGDAPQLETKPTPTQESETKPTATTEFTESLSTSASSESTPATTETVSPSATTPTPSVSPSPISPPPAEETQSPSPATTVTQEEDSPSPPPPEGLTATELAKRLDVTVNTLHKRKNDRDFALWSQTKDPEGIKWQYVEEIKLFVPKKD
ncbi:MAG: hypothetical protein NZ901_02620 [Geminocystis sp.]|nr:hypothetical protein [Geminocystis sp.]HIK37925.1 hypothetical protein [Geminocystis sp. M7585_C2015_104]MCS7147065.1 hypothetical protein [Geminocystis sp.]MCX8079287.1 hypothetical protein [Geminocystis sp.]MDW8115888.1 hypothetical protein [Geminocystis sp.]